MPSVTRDRKKYGAPTVYSEAKREKERRELRERELLWSRDMDPRINDGGNNTGRVYPLIEDDQ